MTDTTAKDARLAWIAGGSLLIASALFPVFTQGVFVPGLGFVSTVLWAGALLVFAFGVRAHGSVVARRPLGVVSLVIAALIPLASTLLWAFLPTAPEDAAWAVPLSQGIQVALVAALLIAAVQIARAGAVPPRARWLPLVMLLVATGTQVVVTAVLMSTPPLGAEGLTGLLTAASIVATAAPLVLGIAAIVLAPRAEPGAVQIYPT